MCPVTIFFFFFNDTATTEISPLSLHAALPIPVLEAGFRKNGADRVGYPSIVGSGPNSTTLHYDVNRRQTCDGDRSEEHTSELQSLAYLVCRLLLEKKKKNRRTTPHPHRQDAT